MKIWRLTPVDLDDSNWRASTHREECIVRAESEMEARDTAHRSFWIAAEKDSSSEPIPVSPWKYGNLIRAEQIDASNHSPDGPREVITPFWY